MSGPNAENRSQRQVFALLFLVVFAALALYWTGNAQTPLWDRDEPRFAEAAREMLHSRDFVVPRFNGEVRYDKPILGYYFFAAGMTIFGENEFGARASSGVLAALSIIALFSLARRVTGSARTALMSAAILAFAPVMVVESKLCTVDALLLFLLLLAFTGLWRIYEGPCGWGWKALFWAALALAVLTKGPVALAAVFTPAVILALLARDRSFLRRFGWLWGVPLFCAIVAPWAIAVQRATDGEFLRVALGKHVVGRSTGAMEGHRGFPGFYVVTLFATFFPWAFFVPGAVVEYAKGLRDRKVELFLLAWSLGLILVLELVKTKMIHYALPVFPALSILVALFVARARETRFKTHLARVPVAIAAAMALALGLGAPAAAWYAGLFDAVLPLAVAGAALLVGMAWWLRTAREWRNLWIGAAATFAWLAVISAWALPELGTYGVSKPLARQIESLGAQTSGGSFGATAPKVFLCGYAEPSLIFYLKGAFEVRTGLENAHFSVGPPYRTIAVVSARSTDVVERLTREQYTKPVTVTGFNFAKGKREEVSLWLSPDWRIIPPPTSPQVR